MSLQSKNHSYVFDGISKAYEFLCVKILMYTSYTTYELRIKTGALHDACHLMKPVVILMWWQSLPCQLHLPGFVLTLDDIRMYILLGDCPNGDNFTISITITFKHTKHYNRIRNLIIFYMNFQ